MSGGASKKKLARSQGWEEAGAEFYQESYPMDADGSFEVLHKDPRHLATLLPSKQTRAAAAATIRLRTADHRTNRTMRRQTSSRSRRDSTVNRRPSMAADVQVSMLPDLSENLSNEQTTWEEIMQIKALPVPMAQKKEMKAKILNEPNLRLQGYEQFKWKRRKVWEQIKSRLLELYDKMELWRNHLKTIEGYFGTGVVAYFLFIKWQLFLNLFIFSLIFVFITLPMIIFSEQAVESCGNASACCAFDYLNQQPNENNIILDIIQGTGDLERTFLFYGYYTNRTFTISDNLYYNMPLAYVCVILLCFLMSLVLIVRSAAKGFRERLIEGEGQFYHYSNIVFCSWDFCIQSAKSAEIKHKAIYNEIVTTLENDRWEDDHQRRTRNERYKIVLSRCIVNLIVLGILAACGCAIYYVFELCAGKLKINMETNTNVEKIEHLLFEFVPSITIVGLNMIVPFIFRFLISFEDYRAVFVLRMTLIRTVLLRLASLVVLYGSLYTKITCDQPINADQCVNARECNTPVCWESYVGQQFYKLLITDFATHFVITFGVNSLRALLARHISNKFIRLIGEQSFDLPKHVLDVVYSQTLCWVGLFYAPLLSSIASVTFFLIFYLKKFACLYNSKPSTIVYRASRSNSMFMLVLLVSYVFALLPLVYSISELQPSRSCGPFRGLDSVWTLIINTLWEMPAWIRSVGFFASTAGFVVPLFVILMLSLYYYSAVNAANRHMVVVLKNQLVLEGHDKQFLLDRLSMFIKQENQKRLMRAEAMREGDRNISST